TASRVLEGTLALTLVAGVNVLGQFALVPVALHFWGSELYGEWVALSALVAFLVVTDLGIQTYVTNRMCSHYARGNQLDALYELHSALRIQLPLLAGLGFVCVAFVSIAPVERLLNLKHLGHRDAAGALLFLMTEVLMSIGMGAVSGLYRATGHLPRAGYITFVNRLALFALPVAAIALGASVIGVAATRVAVGLITWAFVLS